MAKQKGLHKLAGKVDEQSYYYSKNGGYQSRKINPGIGERVKNAPEYQNTRLNNAEFGAAGACAGAMIREVTKRWRFILDSIATGKMVKEIKALMEQDTTSAWGQRTVKLADMPALQDKYNQFSKNEMPELISDAIKNQMKYSVAEQAISCDEVTAGDAFVEHLSSIGATGFRLSLYVFAVSAPSFVAVSRKYAPANASLVPFATKEVTAVTSTSAVIPDVGDQVSVVPQNSALVMSGVLAIFEPLRTVGTSVATLQQHCSAFWHSLESLA